MVGLVTTPGLLPTSIIRAISRHGCRRSNSIPSAGGTWLRSLKKKSSRRSFAPPYDRGRRDPRRESLKEPEPEREREREREREKRESFIRNNVPVDRDRDRYRA